MARLGLLYCRGAVLQANNHEQNVLFLYAAPAYSQMRPSK